VSVAHATPDISYIVSAFTWVEQLPTCLYSLKAQTHRDFEVLVTDNSTDAKLAKRNRDAVSGVKDGRFHYLPTAKRIKVSDPYWSSEIGVKHSSGRWLCFPCDDCYYPPDWGRRMLVAAYSGGFDLMLCEYMMNGPEPCGSDRYMLLRLGSASFPGYKPSFIVRREKFAGWLNKPAIGACSGVDRTTLQCMMRDQKIKWGVARDLYYAHN
jgi:glycosyltransferase involved in cell wall biosynthesis